MFDTIFDIICIAGSEFDVAISFSIVVILYIISFVNFVSLNRSMISALLIKKSICSFKVLADKALRSVKEK